DAHPEEFSFVPHSRVAHQDDDVTEKVTSSWAPVASQASHRQFPFRFIVKTKMSTVLFHHFDFRSVADHLPLLCFVQHSSQRPQSAIGIRGRAWKFQLLSEISRDLVDSQTRNGCRFEQAPAIAIELLGFLLQRAILNPGVKSLSKLRKDT